MASHGARHSTAKRERLLALPPYSSGTLIGTGMQELQTQIAAGAMQLDAVKARIHGAPSAAACPAIALRTSSVVNAWGWSEILHACRIGPDLALSLRMADADTERTPAGLIWLLPIRPSA